MLIYMECCEGLKLGMCVSTMYRLYAMFMMYGCVCEELKAMKGGLNDVIPAELLSGRSCI